MGLEITLPAFPFTAEIGFRSPARQVPVTSFSKYRMLKIKRDRSKNPKHQAFICTGKPAVVEETIGSRRKAVIKHSLAQQEPIVQAFELLALNTPPRSPTRQLKTHSKKKQRRDTSTIKQAAQRLPKEEIKAGR